MSKIEQFFNEVFEYDNDDLYKESISKLSNSINAKEIIEATDDKDIKIEMYKTLVDYLIEELDRAGNLQTDLTNAIYYLENRKAFNKRRNSIKDFLLALDVIESGLPRSENQAFLKVANKNCTSISTVKAAFSKYKTEATEWVESKKDKNFKEGMRNYLECIAQQPLLEFYDTSSD